MLDWYSLLDTFNKILYNTRQIHTSLDALKEESSKMGLEEPHYDLNQIRSLTDKFYHTVLAKHYELEQKLLSGTEIKEEEIENV